MKKEESYSTGSNLKFPNVRPSSQGKQRGKVSLRFSPLPQERNQPGKSTNLSLFRKSNKG